MKTYSENNVAAFHDKEASEFALKAAEFAKLADNPVLEKRDEYLATAAEYRQKAIDAIEKAKFAAQR
jgi:hypothetical protein